MRIIAFICFLFFAQKSFSQEIHLKCSVSQNFKEVLITKVALKPNERQLKFGEYRQFKFFLSDNSSGKNNQIELQVYDNITPSRSYAVTDITRSKSLELSHWTQDYILSVVCTN